MPIGGFRPRFQAVRASRQLQSSQMQESDESETQVRSRAGLLSASLTRRRFSPRMRMAQISQQGPSPVLGDLSALGGPKGPSEDSSLSKESLREEISMLRDELADWPDGTTKEITYTDIDGTEKTEVMTKEQAQALLARFENALAAQLEQSMSPGAVVAPSLPGGTVLSAAVGGVGALKDALSG